MNTAVLILGAGGHGRVLAELAAQVLTAPEIVVLDDDSSKPGVVGPLQRCHDLELRQRCPLAVVALGQAPLRLQWLRTLQQLGYRCPPLVHPSAWVAATAVLGHHRQRAALAQLVVVAALQGANHAWLAAVVIEHDDLGSRRQLDSEHLGRQFGQHAAMAAGSQDQHGSVHQ